MSIFNSVDIVSGSLNIYRGGEAFASQSAYIIRQGIETTGGIKGDTLSITTTNPPTASGGVPVPLLAMGYSDTSEAPRVGIGTPSPKTLFQIESPSSSLEAPDIILTIPSESVSVGDETGRIAFSIADTAFSSSGIVASGSTAAIYSKVLGTGVGGSYGSLVFEINDNIATTEPIKGMELGYGIVDYSGVGLAISGNVDISTGAPTLYLKNTGTGYPVMKLGYNSPTDFSDGELLIFTQGTASIKLSADSSPEDNSFIYYGNLGLGTYTPSEKLEVNGNIKTTGNLIVDGTISTNQILTAATSASSPQYVAVWEGSPSGVPTALKYTTASAFTGGGGSSPYSLGTFGGRYNWSSTESDVRIAHGYTNGPIAGATANDDNFGPYLDTHTIDSTTETFNTYKMQYYALYSPVAGVPHIKAWGRSSDTDFATNGCEVGVSVWSVDTEPSNGTTTTQTATLRATSPTFTVPNSTTAYFGDGMEASGSSSRPAGSFYLVTFDLSGSLAATATLYMNFHLWIE